MFGNWIQAGKRKLINRKAKKEYGGEPIFKRYEQSVILNHHLDWGGLPKKDREIIALIQQRFTVTGGGNGKMFIAGGYAAYLAGFADFYGDVDLYVTNSATNSRLDPKGWIGNEEPPPFEIDVIMRTEKSINQILTSFDINWAMVAYDFNECKLHWHPDADSHLLYVNMDRYIDFDSYYGTKERESPEKTKQRIRKYAERFEIIDEERVQYVLDQKW